MVHFHVDVLTPSGSCVTAESKSVDDSSLTMQGRAVVPKRQVALKATGVDKVHLDNTVNFDRQHGG